jgi:hypothetical protein
VAAVSRSCRRSNSTSETSRSARTAELYRNT